MQTKNFESNIILRKYQNSDIPFMQELYASTREQELAMTNFTLQEKQDFLSQQFSAQYLHYTKYYCLDAFNIVEHNGKDIGRFFVDYTGPDIRIVDIALIPSYRNRGIGSYLLRQLFRHAELDNRSVSIHVEYNNPVRKLYQRLGFILKSKTNDIYLLMEWSPSANKILS